MDASQKKPRHADIVHNTVVTVMESWYRRENDILTEDLQEQEEGYTRIVTNQAAQLRIAAETIRVRELQITQLRRFIHMVMNFSPQARDMFPGDMEEMIMIHMDLNNQLADFIRTWSEETDDEDTT